MAFDYLERALERDPSELANLEVDASADPLRDDHASTTCCGERAYT